MCSLLPQSAVLLAFLSKCTQKTGSLDHITGNQEYSSRTLGATWGIISAVMLPIVVVLICVGWRILKKRKEEEKEESDFLPIKTRPIDPDDIKINSDDESIPYKKDVSEDSPEPTEGVKVADINNYPYDQYQNEQNPQQYPQSFQQTDYQQPEQPQTSQAKPWTGETEIN